MFRAFPQCKGYVGGKDSCPVKTTLKMQDGSAVPNGFSIDLTTNKFLISTSVSIAPKAYKFLLYAETNTGGELVSGACARAPFEGAKTVNDGTRTAELGGVHWTVVYDCRKGIRLKAGEVVPPTTINYNIGSGPYTFKVPAYESDTPSCGFTGRYILQDKYERCDPAWLSPKCSTTIVAGDTITINSANTALANTFLEMQLIVLDQYNSLVNSIMTFTVNFKTGGLTAITCTNCPLSQPDY